MHSIFKLRASRYFDQWPVNPVHDRNRKYYDAKRSTNRYFARILY